MAREELRVSEPRYSIKNLETFYAEQRAGEVKSAGASIVWYERWKETGEAQLLADIRAYNADDCRSTWQLRDWLLRLRPKSLPWASREAEPEADETAAKPWDIQTVKRWANSRWMKTSVTPSCVSPQNGRNLKRCPSGRAVRSAQKAIRSVNWVKFLVVPLRDKPSEIFCNPASKVRPALYRNRLRFLRKNYNVTTLAT